MELAREQHKWEQSKTMARDNERRELARTKWSKKSNLTTKRQNKEQGSRRKKKLKYEILGEDWAAPPPQSKEPKELGRGGEEEREGAAPMIQMEQPEHGAEVREQPPPVLPQLRPWSHHRIRFLHNKI